MLTLDDFQDDPAWDDAGAALQEFQIPDQIEGVILRRLITKRDSRGDLTVLLSGHYVPGFSTPHIYHVSAKAGSVRAWVYHRWQSDQLAYTNGAFRVVLYDLRPGSKTKGLLNVLDIGAANPVQLTIPPYVIHGVQNIGTSDAYFINMPTKAYDPNRPDKARIPKDHPGIPYQFT
jgi:dTDP-4-dehydrorhamnose 3,5-epimerase